jgi:hypothetical protein
MGLRSVSSDEEAVIKSAGTGLVALAAAAGVPAPQRVGSMRRGGGSTGMVVDGSVITTPPDEAANAPSVTRCSWVLTADLRRWAIPATTGDLTWSTAPGVPSSASGAAQSGCTMTQLQERA